mgnify:CR=1 FL=1
MSLSKKWQNLMLYQDQGHVALFILVPFDHHGRYTVHNQRMNKLELTVSKTVERFLVIADSTYEIYNVRESDRK